MTLVGVLLAPWSGVIVYWVLALVMGSLEMFPKRGLRTQVVMRGLWVAWMLLFSDHSNRQAAILALSRDLKESEVNVTA